jgi:hypothetical protein
MQIAGPAAASTLTALIVVANGICSFFGGWLLHRGAAPWVVVGVNALMRALAVVVRQQGNVVV